MNDGEWAIDSPRTIDIDDVREVRAECTAGRLDIVAHAEDFTRVEVAEVSGAPITAIFRDGVLLVRHRSTARGFLKRLLDSGTLSAAKIKDRCVVRIHVPSAVTASASSVVGDCLVAGIAADVHASSVTGPILVDGTRGGLDIDTVSGEAIVRNHTGRLSCESVSGDVTASGRLESVTANTVSGSLALDLLGEPLSVTANTVSGDIRIRVPHGYGVALEAETLTGGIQLNEQSFRGFGKKVRTGDGPATPRVAIHTEAVSGAVAVFNAPLDAAAAPAEESVAH